MDGIYTMKRPGILLKHGALGICKSRQLHQIMNL